MPRTRVAIVDDEPIFAAALAARLDAESDVDVVAVVTTGSAGLPAVTAADPDVALVDVRLDTEDGIDVQRRLLEVCPRTRTMMVTGVTEPQRVVDAMRAGASGWAVKDAAVEELVEALHRVAAGECWISPRLLGAVLAELLVAAPAGPPGPLRHLSDREVQVLQLLVDGRRRSDIAAVLCLSPNTVRTHVQNVLGKLDVHSVLEAVAVALRCGMRPAASPAGAALSYER